MNWQNLKKPFFALAPMADVTDSAFRRVIAEIESPDVMFTEFVSCDGLLSSGKNRILYDLKFSTKERPIIAQLFGSDPNNFIKCAPIIRDLGFDGIDINMGCPDKTIERQGAGASLIKNPELAKEVIRATKEGAGKLPVSVKTRLGYNKNEIEEWLPHLLEIIPAAITIHARTRRELSKVPANWGAVKKAVTIRDSLNVDTIIIGNGDVANLDEGRGRAKETGADGVMIGRAVCGNPWIFSKKNKKDLSLDEVLKVLEIHIKYFGDQLGDVKSFSVMKKHFKAYINGFDGAKELRKKLMDTNTPEDAISVLRGFV